MLRKSSGIILGFYVGLFSDRGLAESRFYREQVAPVAERALDTTSLSLLGLGVFSVGVAYPNDANFRSQWRDHQKMDVSVSRLGDQFGTYGVSFIIAGTQYFLDTENGVCHLRALVYVTAVGSVLKYGFQRERPNQLNYYSFPSGHTYSAFATATSLTYAYGWKVGVWAFPLASVVGLSRVADDYHWLSDVVAGAFLGGLVGRATYYGLADQRPEKGTTKLWLPLVDSERVGFLWQSLF